MNERYLADRLGREPQHHPDEVTTTRRASPYGAQPAIGGNAAHAAKSRDRHAPTVVRTKVWTAMRSTR